MTSVGTKQSKEYIKKLIVEEAQRQGVPVQLALAVAAHESGFNNIAVSKKNTDGSRDHGVFQLNDRYHKLKNVYDPIENIRYGIGMLKAGLKKNKGNVQKTLSDYNAGPNAKGKARTQGDSYAKKVMNLFPQYEGSAITKIANSSPAPVAQINQQGELVGDASSIGQPGTVLEGGVSMEGVPTGAAANPMDAIASGYTNKELLDTSINPTSLEGLVDRINRQAYGNMDVYKTQVDPYLNRQVGDLSQEQLLQLEKERREALQQGLNTMMSDRQGMYDRINNAYNQYMQGLQDDYRLRNTGYQMTPEEIARGQQQLQRQAAINVLAGGTPYAVTPDMINQYAYQQQIANQYGVPYEQYMAAMADIQERQRQAQLQQIQDYITYSKNNGATDQEIIKALGDNEFIKQAVELSNKKAEYEKQVAGEAVKGIGQMHSDSLKEIAKVYSSLPDNARAAFVAQVQGQTGITGDQIKAAATMYNADKAYEATTRGQDIAQETAEMQQDAKNLNAIANFYGMTGQVAGYTPEQQQGIVNTLPAQSRNAVVNPQIGVQQYNQLMNPTNTNQINTTNPLSFQSLLQRFNRPQE